MKTSKSKKLEEMAATYLELHKKLKEIEKQTKLLKEQITEKTEGQSCIVNDLLISIETVERNVFDKKEAEKVIDLSDFYKTTKATYFKVREA